MNKDKCEAKFYTCNSCGNVAELIHDSGMNMICCGREMERQKPGSKDGAVEKHVPVFTVDDGKVKVKVGSEEHPMTKEHQICFIQLVTDKGSYRRNLDHHDTPTATFKICKEEKICAVYAYCNMHGLYVSYESNCDMK